FALLSGCTSAEVTRVDVAGLFIDYGFIVALDGKGRPTRATPAFGIAGDHLTFGSPPAFQLSGAEASFVLLSISKPSLYGDVPAFDVGRVSELELKVEPPPEPPRIVPGIADNTFSVERRISAEARYYRK